jgi:hypothetical protein
MASATVRARIEITPLKVGRRTIALVAAPEYTGDTREPERHMRVERIEFLCGWMGTATTPVWSSQAGRRA